MGLGHARTYLKGYLMAIEKTFIMIKPDAVRDRKIGEIVARIERSGLVIERMEMTTLERATVEEHYAHLADKPFFGGLCDFMTSGPVVKMVVSGLSAVCCSWHHPRRLRRRCQRQRDSRLRLPGERRDRDQALLWLNQL